MSSRDVFFHLLPSVVGRMKASIQKLDLKVEEKNVGVVLLRNRHCTIELSNIENDYVRFWFSSNDDAEAKDFVLSRYLDLVYSENSNTLILDPPKEWEDGQKLDYYLEQYNNLLLNGLLDAPLSGDFSWKLRYHNHLENDKFLSSSIVDLALEGNEQALTIFQKMENKDKSWRDDALNFLQKLK